MKGKNRKKIAVMENSYHGSYYGSMSASNYEEAEKEGYGPMLEGFISLPLPFSRKKKGNVLDDKEKQYLLQQLEEILETNKDTSVSYTHLDVYKRQVWVQTRAWCPGKFSLAYSTPSFCACSPVRPCSS